jgi:hypothetical protein
MHMIPQGNGKEVESVYKSVIRNIYRKDGIKGFYRGFWPHFWRDVPTYGIYFLTYDLY